MKNTAQSSMFEGYALYQGMSFFDLNDTHRGKLFYSFQCKKGCLAASDHFQMFKQSIKIYKFHYHTRIKSTDA